MNMSLFFALLLVVSIHFSCDNSEDDPLVDTTNGEAPEEILLVTDDKAAITAIKVSGNEGGYTFSVTIKSPDTGCKQYANWWEVISTDGTLIYRRILGHSHVNEQPFTRSGSAVNIKKTDEVYIRAHMNTSGYGNAVYKGSVASGFNPTILDTTFATSVAKEEPLPSGCAF